MRKSIFIFVVCCSLISCSAQTEIPYEEAEDILVNGSNYYYKDTNNTFNQFEGTWLSNNENIELTLVLDKDEAVVSEEGYTFDLLVGEYKLVNNGFEITNTLDRINNSNITGDEHLIAGLNILTKYNIPKCPECPEDDRRVWVRISHHQYPFVTGKMYLRHVVENGQELIKAILTSGYNFSDDPNAPDTIPIPYGEYTFVKQL